MKSMICAVLLFLVSKSVRAENFTYNPLSGEVYVANLGTAIGKEMEKRRPVLIVQPNRLTQISPGTLMVVPLSTDLSQRPVERLGIALLRIRARDKLSKDSVFLIDQIRTISPLRFEQPGFLTQLTTTEMWVVETGLRNLLTGPLECTSVSNNAHEIKTSEMNSQQTVGFSRLSHLIYAFRTATPEMSQIESEQAPISKPDNSRNVNYEDLYIITSYVLSAGLLMIIQ